MGLSKLLPLNAVLPHFIAKDKKQAIKMLAWHAAQSIPNIPERDILGVLTEREAMGCTAMGNGVCIPHGRLKELEKPFALFAKFERPIDFDAPDNKLVDLVFLLLTPTDANTEHLKALATMSRLLRDKALCQNLRSTNDPTVLHDLLILAAEDA